MKRSTVVIADDHGVVLEGLVRILSQHYDVVGTASNGYALLEEISTKEPEIVVSDLQMPGLNGIDVLRKVRATKCRTKFVILTVTGETRTAQEACAEGASGYILKQSAATELGKAVKVSLEGGTYIDSSIAPEGSLNFIYSRGETKSQTLGLTDREIEVLRLVAEGRMIKEIASILKISQSTAGFHKYNLMGKLKLRTTAELTQYAIKHDLVAI